MSDGEDGVGRKLEQIADGEKIGRLDVGVDKKLGVQIDENIDDGIKHVARFFGSEDALRKDLGKILFGTFHDDIEKIHAIEAAAAPVEEAEKIRMRELCHLVPDSELLPGGGIIGGDEFDGGLMGRAIRELGEEDGAVVGGSKKMVQREFVVSELAFPSFPNITHDAPLRVGHDEAPSCEGVCAGLETAKTNCRRRGPGAFRVYSRTKGRE